MTIETTAPQAETTNGFAAFGLPHALFKSLEHMKYTNPTPVQALAIPAAMKGKDVLGSAQTGTGKTGAFIIPILARLMTDAHASALIMTPTRELASQILVVARQMLHQNTVIKSALLIGGESMGRQRAQLSARPRLIIGTPGRINDHLRSRNNLFATVNMLVLDEADRMLDMGFTPQINEVIKHMPAKDRQTLMFSATFPKEIINFTNTYMKDPVRVTIEPERTSAAHIKHEHVETNEANRYNLLTDELIARQGSIIIFIKTKHGADRMQKRLAGDGHSVDVIHGGLTQNKRDRAIAGFRAKKTRIMVATDVAARGLDVPHIEHVINYDLPQVAEDYVHRIGRTGRNGQEGRALSFLMPSERGKWNAIQRVLNPGQKPERGNRRGGGNNNYNNSNRNSGFKKPQQPRNFGHMDQEFEMELQQAQAEYNQARQDKPKHQNGQRRDFGNRSERFDRNNSGAPQRKYVNHPRADKSHLIDPPMRASDLHAPTSDADFNSAPPARMERAERGDRSFKQRRDFNDKKNKPFHYKDRNGERNGNVRRNDQDGPERNFNVEGASGEDRFSMDGDRPMRSNDRKPQGPFWAKKKNNNKSFGKDRKPNGQRPNKNFKKSA